MRALFLEVLVDGALEAGLGIEHGCLLHISELVTRVSQSQATALRDRKAFTQAYADFGEFVSRMVRDAKKKGYSSLHEDTFFAARDQCGLIFWCK